LVDFKWCPTWLFDIAPNVDLIIFINDNKCTFGTSLDKRKMKMYFGLLTMQFGWNNTNNKQIPCALQPLIEVSDPLKDLRIKDPPDKERNSC